MFKFFKKNTSNLPDFWNVYEKKFENKIPEKIEDISFVALDTETTGFDYIKDRMLCIGALKMKNQRIEIKNGLEVYIRQEVYGKESAKVHGILKNETIPRLAEMEALEQFLIFVEDSVIIAHHAIFDLNMINNALVRNGLPRLKNKYIDTSNLYKKTLIKSNLLTVKNNYSLDELADKFNVSKKDRHTALGDAYIAAILFLKILAKLKEKKEVTSKWLLK